MQFKKSFQPVIYFILGLFACCLTVSFVHADQLSKQIDHMSLQDKIAQMYFVPSDGNQNDILNAIQQYHVGGVVLFGADFQNQTSNQFKAKLDGWQKASQIPLFIGTDQEGGTVSRLSDNPQLTNNRQFSSPQALNNNMQTEVNEARNVAEILHNLGINWNFAPPLPMSRIIHKVSFIPGHLEKTTSKQQRIFQRSFRQFKAKRSLRPLNISQVMGLQATLILDLLQRTNHLLIFKAKTFFHLSPELKVMPMPC